MSPISKEEAALKRNFLKKRQSLPLKLKKLNSQKIELSNFTNTLMAKVYVSSPVGKDSTVLLHLVRSLFPKVPAVFVDTGLEYPEVRSFIKSLINVTVLRPEIPFNKVITSMDIL